MKLSENLAQLEQSSEEIYIAVGIVSGVVMMIVILVMSLVMISRRKSHSVSPATITTSPGNSPPESTYDPYDSSTGHLAKASKMVSSDGSSKVLLSWLESLPNTDESEPPPSPPASNNHSLDSSGVNTISQRNHTLTRTNP